MANEVVNLRQERALRENDSTKWTAEDALRFVLKEIEDGKVKPTRIAVHYTVDKDEHAQIHHFCVAGLTREAHIALLHFALAKCVADWQAD